MRHVKGQATYDSLCQPDDLCPGCGYESSCDCICTYDDFITADDLAEAADELATERLEIIISNDVPADEIHFVQHGKVVGKIINVDTIADRLRKELAEIEGGGE